jgi:hypothetical protein
VSELDQCVREPHSLADTGLCFGLLADLALKSIYFANELTGQGVVEHLKLPFAHVVEDLVAFLVRDDLLTIVGSTGLDERGYKYVMTPKGSAKVQEILVRSQYAGPAPVPLMAYIAVIHTQSIGEVSVDSAQLHAIFSPLVISEKVLSRVGPAVNSARSISFTVRRAMARRRSRKGFPNSWVARCTSPMRWRQTARSSRSTMK